MKNYYRVLEMRGADAWESEIFTTLVEAKEEMELWLNTHTVSEIKKLEYLYIAVYNTREDAEEIYCDHKIIFNCVNGEIKEVADYEY